jgi:hypothetical protein
MYCGMVNVGRLPQRILMRTKYFIQKPNENHNEGLEEG